MGAFSYERTHSDFLARIFPRISEGARRNALIPLNTALFKRGVQALQPSIAFLNPETRFLITDGERLNHLPPQQKSGFVSVTVLESRSHRARFLITEDGQVVEFKGLTPNGINAEKKNPNSGQPNGLLELGPAEDEVTGLHIIGGIESGKAELGDHFEDLSGYAQIFRAASAGNRYFCWMRMDADPAVYELLAGLEGKKVEYFLYKSGLRFGRQLRKLHKGGMTLHFPFGHRASSNEPFFSTLHSGNVEIHGNIIDLEGLAGFGFVEKYFREEVLSDPNRRSCIPERHAEQMRDSYPLFCRASDLHTFLGGRSFPAGPSVSAKFLGRNGAAYQFYYMLSGITHGYFEIKDPAVREEIDRDLKGLVEHAKKNGWQYFPFGQTLNIVKALAF